MTTISGGVSDSGRDQQMFNAQLVTKTLDTMNNRGNSVAPVDKASFDGALVTKTLDTMNPGSGSDKTGSAQSYNFQKDVLSAHTGMGIISDMMI